MSRFNEYMRNHFASCRLLAEGFDACRSREVKVYALPGFFEDVGFSDGTDAWIVPLAAESCTGAGSLLKGVNLRELVGHLKNGESPAVARIARPGRRRVVLDDAPIRRRPLTTTPEPTQAPRRRHVTLA